MSHTPGPWKAWAAEDGAFEVCGDTPQTLVLCSRTTHEKRAAEFRANARLIAAAPELLEALKAARKEIVGYADELIVMAPDCGYGPPECLEQVDAAIAKAEGK